VKDSQFTCLICPVGSSGDRALPCDLSEGWCGLCWFLIRYLERAVGETEPSDPQGNGPIGNVAELNLLLA